jgi:hypothetical protein
MFAVVLLMAVGVGLSALDHHAKDTALRTSQELASRIAADAGLEKSVHEMNEQLKITPWDDSSLPYTIHETIPACDNAVFTFSVRKDGKGGYAVQSVGESGRMLKRVRATLGLSGLFESAILSRGDLILKSGTKVTAYNSEDPSDTTFSLQVATTSIESDVLDLKSGVVIDGDVLVGVGGDPDEVIKDSGATTGRRYAMSVEPPFPRVTPPGLIDKGKGIKTNETTTIGPADSGEYAYIDVSGKGTALEVDGGDVVLYVAGDVELGNESEIAVKAGSTLQMYVDGNIECDNGASISHESSPKSPKHLQLYATGKDSQSFDLKAKNHFSGVVYAPNAAVQINAKGDIYGSMIAEDFEFKAGGDFYYDEALKNVNADDVGVRFVVKRWSED